MSKSRKLSPEEINSQALGLLHDWECLSFNGHSEIRVSSQKGQEVVATVYDLAGIGHGHLANYICEVINKSGRDQNILRDALDALQVCLTEASMTFSTEQAAEAVVGRIQRICL